MIVLLEPRNIIAGTSIFHGGPRKAVRLRTNVRCSLCAALRFHPPGSVSSCLFAPPFPLEYTAGSLRADFHPSNQVRLVSLLEQGPCFLCCPLQASEDVRLGNRAGPEVAALSAIWMRPIGPSMRDCRVWPPPSSLSVPSPENYI